MDDAIVVVENIHRHQQLFPEKSLADIKAFLAKNNGACAIACDANDSPNARPVAEAVQAAGGYVSTIWNKTDDAHPWDFGDNWVSHMSWSDEKPAEDTARILFEAMGGGFTWGSVLLSL